MIMYDLCFFSLELIPFALDSGGLVVSDFPWIFTLCSAKPSNWFPHEFRKLWGCRILDCISSGQLEVDEFHGFTVSRFHLAFFVKCVRMGAI